MNGIRIRLETKPGKSLACAGTLPSSSASAMIAARGLVRRLHSPRITSTSFRTGTGLKKCIPITPVRPARDRSEGRDRDRRGVGGEHASPGNLVRAAEEGLLDGGVLDHCLDQEVGGTRSSTGAHALSTSSGSAPPFSASLARLVVPMAARRSHPGRRRRARRASRRPPRPGRSRLPSGPRPRRERARSPRRGRLTSTV